MASREQKNKDPQVLEHEYDGIQEYDNPMPRWWLMTFAGTIIFSIIYYFNVGPVGNGNGRIADYEADVKAFAAAHPAPSGGGVSNEQLLALARNPQEIAAGKETFVKNCAACHAPDGGGLIGPNLTDTFWIHGGTAENIYLTIARGVLDKGMPPWEKVLKPQDVLRVTAYVLTLQGTKPASPKAAQGDPAQP
jgi:cytochrome c oxidase cbb3-type subunit 3